MNITLKDVPPELHQRLRAAADESGRSLNKLILVTLEQAVVPQKIDRRMLLKRIQDRRQGMVSFMDDAFLSASIREGRE